MQRRGPMPGDEEGRHRRPHQPRRRQPPPEPTPPAARASARDTALATARNAAFDALSARAGSRRTSLRAWGLVHGLAMLLLDGALAAEDLAAPVRELLQG